MKKSMIYCVQFQVIDPPCRQDYWFTDWKKSHDFLESVKFHPNVSACVIAGFEVCELSEFDGKPRNNDPVFAHSGIKKSLYPLQDK